MYVSLQGDHWENDSYLQWLIISGIPCIIGMLSFPKSYLRSLIRIRWIAFHVLQTRVQGVETMGIKFIS